MYKTKSRSQQSGFFGGIIVKTNYKRYFEIKQLKLDVIELKLFLIVSGYKLNHKAPLFY